MMEILEQKFLGSGAHWIVFRIILKEPVLIDNKYFTQLAYKVSNSGKGNIENNILAFTAIRDAHLPTLAFYQKESVSNQDCILTEDLNFGEKTYVSPNTARNLPSEELKLIRLLANIYDDKYIYISDQQPSYYENELTLNKIERVDNFMEIIETLLEDMKRASEYGLGMCEDAFFFGIRKNGRIILDYKIADFDTIITHDIELSEEIIKRNQIVALNALSEFIMFFLTKNHYYKQYNDYLKRKITKLMKEIGET